MKLKNTFAAPLFALTVMLLLTATRFVDLSGLGYRENIFLAIIVLQLLILIIPAAFYIKLRGNGFSRRLRLSGLGIDKLLVAVLAALVLIFGEILIKLGLYKLGWISGDYTVWDWYLGTADPSVLYSLFAFALVPAVAEELVFRSILCAEYEKSGPVTAVIASAAIYAMFGLNPVWIPIFFFEGLIFGLLLYLTRSVFAPMLCHLINRIFVMAAGETVWNIIIKPQSSAFLIFAASALFLVCLAGLLGEGERIYFSYSLANKNSDYTAGGPAFSAGRFAEAMLSPPFLVLVLIFLAASWQLA